jgi:UDP-N-acetylmuramyl pentapeptide phosphotransferase/UDP-N-acetylglucosamine-1-phosphate transferase
MVVSVRCATAIVALRVGSAAVPEAIARAPERLRRTNVSGARVPAVLGGPLLAAVAAGLLTEALASRASRKTSAVAAGVALAFAGAGLVDDLRGDEPARGFAGHLAALRRGRVTGGVIKTLVGGSASLAAGRATARGRDALEAAALIALSANLVNLLDRAPGRAAKAALAGAAPLAVAGDAEVEPVAWSLLGALGAVAPADLAEDAMLGDAGANPLGALLGWALAASLGRGPRRAVLAALAALNLASERWSFSRAIDRVPALRRLDRAGRRRFHPAPGARPRPNPGPAC